MDSIDAAELALSLPEVDPARPSPARIYDFWLGGSQNFEADREAGRRAAEAMPALPASAQATNPDATVVYIDIDPVAIAHARTLLADNPTAHAALADLREPDDVLNHPLVRDTIDWTKPVAVMLFAVLHFIPDSSQAEQIVHAFTKPLAPGSYLAISHGAPDRAALEAQQNAARDYASRTGVPFIARTAEEITPWLAGLEIQPPGVEDIRVWLPALYESHKGIAPFLGALARKPDVG